MLKGLKNNRYFNLALALFTIIFIFNSFATSIYAETSKLTREELYKKAQKTIDYYYNNYKENEFEGILDWPALGLFGFKEDVSGEKWTTKDGKNGVYWREQQVKEGSGLRKSANTDYQRTIIGVCSAGKDPRNFGVLNLVEIEKNTMLFSGKFADSVEDNKTKKPVGEDLINAHIFGIISLYCAGEPIPDKDKALKWLEKQQHPDGGYTYDVKYFEDPEDYALIDSDIDMTAAALMAFGILGEDESNPVVQKALNFLHERQIDDGGFESWGSVNPESCSWVILALTSIGQDPMGEQWTTKDGNNPTTALLKFQLKDGSFTHVLSEYGNYRVSSNAMSTEQSLYGMASAYNNKSVFKMLHEKYRPQAEKSLFSDYKPEDFAFKETMDLVYDYTLSGYPDGTFKPNKSVTRSEFPQYLVNVLGLKGEAQGSKDFPDTNWADECIKICADKGYITGTANDTNSPDENITGEQLMVILIRAAGLEEKAKAMNEEGKEWSYGYLKLAKEMGFIYEGFKPKEAVNRVQCAWGLVRLGEKLD